MNLADSLKLELISAIGVNAHALLVVFIYFFKLEHSFSIIIRDVLVFHKGCMKDVPNFCI